METFVSAFVLVDTSCQVRGSLEKVIELLDPNIQRRLKRNKKSEFMKRGQYHCAGQSAQQTQPHPRTLMDLILN